MADLTFGVQQAQALVELEVTRFLNEVGDQLIVELGDTALGDRSLIGLATAMLLQNAFNERLIKKFPQLGTWKGGQGGGITIKG